MWNLIKTNVFTVKIVKEVCEMRFLQDLYLGDSIVPKVNRIVKKIINNQILPELYLITIALNPENMLDIIPEWEVTQKGYPKDKLMVIGITEGKKDAIDLVQSIVKESLDCTGSADVRAYLSKKWEGQI